MAKPYHDMDLITFQRRFWPGQGFDRLLRACSNATPVTYAELRG